MLSVLSSVTESRALALPPPPMREGQGLIWILGAWPVWGYVGVDITSREDARAQTHGNTGPSARRKAGREPGSM